MYTTIEADVERGQILGPEAGSIPCHAHVLITLLDSIPEKRPAFGSRTSAKVTVVEGALAPLSGSDLEVWGL